MATNAFDFTDVEAQAAAGAAIDGLVAAIPGGAAHRDEIADAVYAAVNSARLEILAEIRALLNIEG